MGPYAYMGFYMSIICEHVHRLEMWKFFEIKYLIAVAM